MKMMNRTTIRNTLCFMFLLFISLVMFQKDCLAYMDDYEYVDTGITLVADDSKNKYEMDPGDPMDRTFAFKDYGKYPDGSYYMVIYSELSDLSTNPAKKGISVSFYTKYSISYHKKTCIKILNSDNSVVTPIDGEDAGYFFGYTDGLQSYQPVFEVKNYGKCDVSIIAGDAKMIIHFFVLPYTVEIKDIQKLSYNEVRITYNAKLYDGYYIYKKRTSEFFPEDKYYSDSEKWDLVGKIDKDDSYADIKTDRDVNYTYRVRPYFSSMDGKIFFHEEKDLYYYDGYTKQFLLPNESITISLVESDEKTRKISWTPVIDATSYEVYLSQIENGVYKKIKETDSKTLFSVIDVKENNTYYYIIRAIYPDGSYVESESFSVYIVSKKTAKKKLVKINVKQQKKKGNYSIWRRFSDPDTTHYYLDSNNNCHIVSYYGNKLYDYTLKGNGKVKTKKTITLGKHDKFGAFYYGEDGYFYVALGIDNLKESKKKTVIRVLKFDKKWKKISECNIRGDASNRFVGIYSPFQSSNCRMALKGNQLILITGRTMFSSLSQQISHSCNDRNR